MTWRRLAAALVALGVCTGAQAAQYDDPDAPETQAAARAALTNAKIVAINAKIINIVGIVLGIEAILKDLDAKVTEREIRITLPADVLFDFDKATIRADAADALGKVANVLTEYKSAPVDVEGHTDGKGRADYNQKLSERRAQSVKDWLVRNGGIAAARMRVRGYGMTKPVVPNTKADGRDDPEGRQKNRRVEFVIHKR
jgi:outer membrane protein OmpA-like peptidoglycan-associated protein